MRLPRELVLAIYPFARGIAFVCFEGPLSPVDWGVRELSGPDKNARALKIVQELIERLQPDVLVLEDAGARRAERIRRLSLMLRHHAVGQAIDSYLYDRDRVRQCFAGLGARTRYEIAQAIAGQVRALDHRLPPVRPIWKSEASRMSLFDAAALAITHYWAMGLASSPDA